MILRKQLTAAVTLAALGAAVPAVHAQTLTVTAATPTTAGGSTTYNYTVTSSITTNLLIFNFSDTNFTSETGNGPLTFNSPNSVPSGGVFAFDSGTLPAGTSEVFTFVSPDGPGGTLGATGISYTGSGVAAVNGVTPAPTPAPEPGALVSMSVLGACLGLSLVARRKTLAN